MGGSHCKDCVEKSIADVEGVESVEISLTRGIAM